MSLTTVLLIVLLLVVFGGLPLSNGPWIPHDYGYYPSGIGTILVIVLLVLIFSGRLRF